MRKALAGMRWIVAFKSLVLFTAFYISYVSLSTVRMDWWAGHETITWLHEAHDKAHVPRMDSMDSLHQVTTYIDHDLAKVVSMLKATCISCQVALSPKATDLGFLGLDDFVCSDFDSISGSNDYPKRDCKLADASWAARPTSKSAPCCENATLIQASMGMMTESLACARARARSVVWVGGGREGRGGAVGRA